MSRLWAPLVVGAVIAVAAGSALGATPATASTATSASTAAPAATATSATTAAPAAPVASTATPAATTAAATATATPLATTAADPSLAVQNAAGDHAMGSTVAVNEPAAATPRLRSLLATPSTSTSSSQVLGMDVSAWQGTVDWKAAYSNGARFAYIKATESSTYTSSTFSAQYSGAAAAGIVRGAYTFAVPNKSSGATQAAYLLNHGGGWSADGKTLPPLLDIEYDPYTGTDGTNTCYGLSASGMVNWITSFSNTVYASIGRYPAIYSTTDWWSKCTGNSSAFGHSPLFVARYGPALSSGPGTLPASWSSWTIWQYADSGAFPGDQDVINGGGAALAGLAVPASLQSPKGSVDSVKTVPGGIEVRGWAIDPNTAKSIGLAVYIDSTGHPIQANLARPDVAAAYPADGALHGFDAVIPAAYGTHRVCIYGLNVGVGTNALLAPCVSVFSAGSAPVGSVDSVTSTPAGLTATGWALDGDTASSIHVAVYVDGKAAASPTASRARSDVAAQFPAYGAAHGYSVTLPEKQGSHSVCVYAINVGAAGSNPRLSVCHTVVVNHTPIGHVDSVTVSGKTITATGWTIDQDTPLTSTRMAIYVGAAGKQTVANLSRSDIAAVYPSAGALHGYKTSMSTTTGSHRVCVYAIDTSGGSNPTLKCVTVTVK